jgi:hypothetical protein
MRGVASTFALMLLVASSACNGGSGSGGNGGQTPTPQPPASQNPCQSASLEAEDLPAAAPANPSAPGVKNGVVDRDPRWRVLDALWLHREAQARRAGRQPQAGLASPEGITAPPARPLDVGAIAVVQDTGDLILPGNAIDLETVGLRFTRNGSGGYDASRIDAAFRSALGNRIALSDDDSAAVPVRFGFPFYGQNQTSAFVNSDGNITFEEEDRASTERNVARLLTGPPRIAPFLADLDPSTGNGRIFVNAALDQHTVTWCTVRGFESTSTITAQVTLLPDGTIEFKYERVLIADAVVGVSPGRTGIFTPVNLSDASSSGGAEAVGERFAARAQLDTVAMILKFYQSHGDLYDQLVVWTDLPYLRDGFAYEQTVANEVRGIGIPVFDLSREFGSGGRLRSMAMMDFIGKYPDDPRTRVTGLGENTTLSVLGQEVGHRWLAFVNFLDHRRERSDMLLGRGAAHWSFFMDSDASVMEGNDIEELGGGSFRTVAAVQRYSLLDQYLMGLIPPSAVPPFFYVEGPENTAPIVQRESAPRVGVTFVGTKREVRVDDIIAIHEERQPAWNQTSKVHRQAFILVVTAGRDPDSDHIDKIDRIRRAWEAFFVEATGGRMTADTRLF